MEPDERAELAALRRRAYGPAGEAGPADLERLRVLEARAGAGSTVRPTSAPGGQAAPTRSVADADADPHADPAADRDAADDLEAEDAADPARPRRRLRRLGILWAASIVLAIAATAFATSQLTAPPGQQVTALRLDPDRPLPEYMQGYFGGSEEGTAEFLGLTVVRLVDDRYSSPPVTGDCLSIQSTAQGGNTSFGGACAAGGFTASVQIVVDFSAPTELRDRFPVGTALLFELDGMTVQVRQDASADRGATTT